MLRFAVLFYARRDLVNFPDLLERPLDMLFY